MKSDWNGVGPNLVTAVLIRGTFGQRLEGCLRAKERQRQLPTTRGREEATKDPLLEASERARLFQHPDSRLPASRAAGQYIPSVPSLLVALC